MKSFSLVVELKFMNDPGLYLSGAHSIAHGVEVMWSNIQSAKKQGLEIDYIKLTNFNELKG